MRSRLNKLAIIFISSLFLISCDNTDSDVESADVIVQDSITEVEPDYSVMSFLDQELDMQSRLDELRTSTNDLNEDEKSVYQTEVDNLEVEIERFKEKRAASEADEENETLKAAAQEAADKVRAASDALKADIKATQDKVQNTKEEIKGDIKEKADEIQSDVQNKKEDIKDDIEDAKRDLKSNIKETKKEVKSDIKDVANEVKEDVKDVFK